MPAKGQYKSMDAPAPKRPSRARRDGARLAVEAKPSRPANGRSGRSGEPRICAHDGCGTVLSRYNSGTVCGVHEGIPRPI